MFRMVIKKLIFAIFDILLILPSFVDVHIRRRHKDFIVLQERPIDGSAVAIVAVYAPRGLLPTTLRLFDALASEGIQVVVISNASLSEDDQNFLREKAHVVIQRSNIGRDFGAYQCGWKYLCSINVVPDILLFANDSVHYLPGIEMLIRKILESPEPYQGVTENYESYPHVSSYFFAVRSQVVKSDAFHEFWKKFKPYSTRKHAIQKGELELSKCLIQKGGYVPYVHFTSNKLWLALERAPANQVVQDAQLYMPKEFLALFGDTEVQPIGYLQHRKLIQQLIWYGETRSQVHVYGMLFVIYLKLPLIKRDLCSRGTFYPSTVLRMLQEVLNKEEIEVIEKDLRGKGMLISKVGLRRFLFVNGRI